MHLKKKSALLLKDFLPVAKNLLDHMINQGASKQMQMLLKHIKKTLNRHPEAFQNYHIRCQIV